MPGGAVTRRPLTSFSAAGAEPGACARAASDRTSDKPMMNRLRHMLKLQFQRQTSERYHDSNDLRDPLGPSRKSTAPGEAVSPPPRSVPAHAGCGLDAIGTA